MKLEQILWYARRARTMEHGELRARAAGALSGAAGYFRWLLAEQDGHRRKLDPAAFHFCRSEGPALPDLPWRFELAEAEQSAMLAGVHHALGYEWTWTAEPKVWHRAPDTGRLWPEKYADLIDYRPGNPIGDARVIWEPNRLQQLVDLALLARYAPERSEAAANLLRRQLLSWFEANPARVGINYTSAMECALRILSICVAADLVRSRLKGDAAFWSAVATLAIGHAALVNARLSLFSSLGNHTVAECTGLFVAALLFPEAEAAAEWEMRARKVLEQAARREIMADGGPAEQALHYHAQVLDHLEIAVRIGKHFRRDMAALEAILRTGAQFLSGFRADRKSLPRIGDDDEGNALSRFFASSWADGGARDASARSNAPISMWTAGGYTIVRSIPDDAELVLDHGPLGMAPNFGHGHADALAIHLSIGGVAVLIDPGTCCYGGEPRWRSYFRSTAAHNTVTVDGLSQAKEAGPFLWSTAYDCRLLHAALGPDGGAILIACHDGYRALGVVHYRAVKIVPGFILVLDRVEGAAPHVLALHWHFAGEAREVDGGCALDEVHGFRCKTAGGEPRLLHGSEAPPAGWRCERYGRKQPISTLEVRANGALPHEFSTGIALPSGGDWPDVHAEIQRLGRLMNTVCNAAAGGS